MVCRADRGSLDESESELLSLPIELRRTENRRPNVMGPNKNRDWAPVLVEGILENTIRDIVPKGIVQMEFI